MEKRKGCTRRKHAGFMLLELVVVIAIVGILAAFAIPNLVGLTDDAKVARIQSDLSSIGTAVEMFYVKNGRYPSTLNDVAGSEDGKYLRQLPTPPDSSITYTLGNRGEVTATFKGVTYSSYGTKAAGINS